MGAPGTEAVTICRQVSRPAARVIVSRTRQRRIDSRHDMGRCPGCAGLTRMRLGSAVKAELRKTGR
jgi:hypothetical protein